MSDCESTHDWERAYRDGVAVAARCRRCLITPLEYLYGLTMSQSEWLDTYYRHLDESWRSAFHDSQVALIDRAIDAFDAARMLESENESGPAKR